MALPSSTSTIKGCKRAAICLCRHCDKDICLKHLQEHQAQVNNELVPLTGQLNERERLTLLSRFDDDLL